MNKWLIKSTNEFRVETMAEVDKFKKLLAEEAQAGGYNFNGFSWKECVRKQNGEAVESWFIVKYTLVFNDPKMPMHLFTNVDYNSNDLKKEDASGNN